MQDRWEELRRRGARALVVSFAPPEQLADYRTRLGLRLPLGSDPSRAAYRAYGLTRGPFWRIWGPRTLWTYAKLVARGRKLQRPREKEDLSQLGGDFIVGPTGALRFVHLSRNPADRPPVERLLRALAAPGGSA